MKTTTIVQETYALKTPRVKFISKTLDNLLSQIQQVRGAGAYDLSVNELNLLKNYVLGNGPNIQTYDITDDDITCAYQLLKEKTKILKTYSYGYVRAALQSKGAVNKKSTEVGTEKKKGLGWGRRNKILKSYLMCGGISAITGNPIAIGNSNVDHITSLNNGGKDEPKNWIWMETNLNMKKGAKTDTELIEEIEKDLLKTPMQIQKKKLKHKMVFHTKLAYKTHWKSIFSNGGNGGLFEDDLNNMTVQLMKNIIRGWNLVYPATSEFYVNTYKTQIGGSRGGGRGIAVSRNELKTNFITQLNKKETVLSNKELCKLDSTLQNLVIQIKNNEFTNII